MSPKGLRDQVLGHADEADGIEEYDNPLPDWWLGLFWICIVWAFAYFAHYHFIAHRSEVKELAAELAAAKQQWPEGAAELPVVMSAANIAEGKVVFTTYCQSCHGAELTGGIGANLVDTTWIHGGRSTDIVHTITAGVAAKGMPMWGPVLGPEKIAQVAAYIASKNGHIVDLATGEAGEPHDGGGKH